MKVILLKNVPKKGKKYDVLDINPGYARNYLIPEGLAVLATPKELQNVEKMKKKAEEDVEKLKEEFDQLKGKLKKVTLKIKRKASKEGKLFGSVDKEDLKEALLEEKINLPQAFEVDLKKSLKEIGEHKVNLKYGNKKIPLNVIIEEVKEKKSDQKSS